MDTKQVAGDVSPGRLSELLVGIDEAFDGDAWHGPNLWGSLRRVSAEQAGWRPAPDRHNIREVAVHGAYWKYIVRRRLTEDRTLRFPERGSNWFPRPEIADRAGWKSDLDLLARQHGELRAVISGLTTEQLSGDRGSRRLRLIRGIAAHDVYHAGQIRLLLRLLPRPAE